MVSLEVAKNAPRRSEDIYEAERQKNKVNEYRSHQELLAMQMEATSDENLKAILSRAAAEIGALINGDPEDRAALTETEEISADVEADKIVQFPTNAVVNAQMNQDVEDTSERPLAKVIDINEYINTDNGDGAA